MTAPLLAHACGAAATEAAWRSRACIVWPGDIAPPMYQCRCGSHVALESLLHGGKNAENASDPGFSTDWVDILAADSEGDEHIAARDHDALAFQLAHEGGE